MRQLLRSTTSVWLLGAAALWGAACARDPLPFSEMDAGGRDVGPAAEDGGPEAGAAPAVDWAIPVGPQPSTTVPGRTTLAGVVALLDGGVVVAGTFFGTVAFAPDKTLMASNKGAGFVARYRRDRQLVWVTALSADQSRVAGVAALGNDEIALTGWFGGTLTVDRPSASVALASAGGIDIFVMRVAADGSVRWVTRAGGRGDDIARAISARSVPRAGAPAALVLAITGATGNEPSFGNDLGAGLPPEAPPGSGPIYVAALDGGGSLRWVAFAGDGVPGQGYGVAVLSDGGAVATGYINGKGGFGGDPSGIPITIDPKEGRGFVARWDGNGRTLWAQPFGGPEGEGDAISVGAGDQIAAAGLFNGEARFGRAASAPRLTADVPGQAGAYVAALSPAGETVWARRLTGAGLRVWRMHATSDGDLLFAASFGGGVVIDPDGPAPLTVFSKGNDDAAFIRLRGDGVLRWATTAGGLGDEEGFDLALASDGTSWAVGDYDGPATIGGEGAVTLTSGTDGSSFLLHLAR